MVSLVSYQVFLFRWPCQRAFGGVKGEILVTVSNHDVDIRVMIKPQLKGFLANVGPSPPEPFPRVLLAVHLIVESASRFGHCEGLSAL